MRKATASGVFRLCINVLFFALTLAGLFATFFWLAIPIILIGLPVAIFAKSKQAKGIALSCLIALAVLTLAFNIQAIVNHTGPFGP